jgi:hypothetical protein
MESHGTDSLDNSTVSAVLISNQVIEVSLDERVSVERIFTSGDTFGTIKHERLARVFTGNKVMEDTESISTVRVSDIITEFTDFGVFRANVRIVRRSHSSKLGIIPVSITVRTSSMVVSELVIGMSDPERSRSLVSVDE